MAAAGRTTNWFAIWVTAAVIAVVAIVTAVVVVGNTQATSPGTPPDSQIVNAETGAISFGSGQDVVATYVDFMCPACNAFEQTFGASLDELASANKITLDVHPIAILDRLSNGTKFSTRSANAMYCVAETSPGAVLPFLQGMFAQQPAEVSDGLSDEQILAIATSAGAGDVSECVTEVRYEKFVAAMTKKLPADPATGRTGTPTVTINGEYTSLNEIAASTDYFTERFGG